MSKQNLVVCCVSICLFLTSFVGNALTVAVPFFVEHYHTLPQYAAFALSGYAIALACFLIPASIIAKHYGYKKVFAFGLISCGIVTFLIPFSPALWILVAGRLVQGATAALCMSTGTALIAHHIEHSKRYIAIGIAVCFTFTGVSVTLMLSGIIIDNWGYQWMFYFAAVCFLVLYFYAQGLPNDSKVASDEEYIPYFKIALFVFSVGLCLLSLTALGSIKYAEYGVALGAALLGYLALRDYLDGQNIRKKAELAGLNGDEAIARHSSIVIPVHLMIGNKAFTYCFLVSTAAFMSVMAEPVILALFSQYTLGISATVAGFIIVVQPVVIAIVSFFSGFISRAIGGNATVTLGLIIQTIGLASFVVIDETTTIWGLAFREIVVGAGFALFSAPNTTIITFTVEKANYALASSMQELGRSLGDGVSLAILTITIATAINVTPDSAEYAKQFAHASVIILAICALLGLLGIFYSALGYMEAKERKARIAAQNAAGTVASYADTKAIAAATESVAAQSYQNGQAKVQGQDVQAKAFAKAQATQVQASQVHAEQAQYFSAVNNLQSEEEVTAVYSEAKV